MLHNPKYSDGDPIKTEDSSELIGAAVLSRTSPDIQYRRRSPGYEVMAESIVLSNSFSVISKKKSQKANVTLSKHTLTYAVELKASCCVRGQTGLCEIDLRDVYGARAFQNSEDSTVYFHVYSCPLRKRRQRKVTSFKITDSNSVSESVAIAEKWIRTILWLARDSHLDVSEIEAMTVLPPSRKLLVLINPSSGKGKSSKIFFDVVEPMFKEAEIDYEVIITEFCGHGREIAMAMVLSDWDGVVICSGDGLVYEVVNGLMSRPDWKEAIQMPCGVVPTGSGNALCFSSLYASGEPFDIVSAIFAIICGNCHKLDICSITTPKEKIYSFLSITWGIVSDVDIESEKYRFLGETRFLVGTLVRLVGLRVYRGKLSYLPVEDDRVENCPLEGKKGLVNLGASCLHEEQPCSTEMESSFSSGNGPLDTLLAPLGEHLAGDWKVIDGEFVLACPLLLSHLNSETLAGPEAKFGDGLLHIMYVKSGISRMQLLDLFGKLEDGSHIQCDKVVVLRAKAFRLEPDLSQKGIIAVDGEQIDYTAIQGQVHQGLGRVMCVRPTGR